MANAGVQVNGRLANNPFVPSVPKNGTVNSDDFCEIIQALMGYTIYRLFAIVVGVSFRVVFALFWWLELTRNRQLMPETCQLKLSWQDMSSIKQQNQRKTVFS